jgi:two-component system sensor histidine kinase UhpB
VSEATTDIRRISTELRPIVLDDVGLEAALRRLVAEIATHAEPAIELTVELSSGRLGAEVETVVFRIAQEAINNAIKSARASRIDVVLRTDGAGVFLSVTDDGVGFDADVPKGLGLGLPGMHERAELIGAKLTIDSAPGAGTTVRLELDAETGGSGS